MTTTNPSLPITGRAALRLSLREHNVGLVVPQGTTMALKEPLKVPYGALIAGTIVGDIECLSGSLIVAGNGKLEGNAKALRVYIEGTITGPNKTIGNILARDLFAAGSASHVNANIQAGYFATHQPKINGVMRTIDDKAYETT